MSRFGRGCPAIVAAIAASLVSCLSPISAGTATTTGSADSGGTQIIAFSGSNGYAVPADY